MRVRPEVDRLLYAEIAAHRAAPDAHDDILALLTSARDADGQPLSDENLLDQIITLLLAGHETTTTGLAWAFERLVRHPAALKRLKHELKAGEEQYLDAVVNETLRVRPVIDGVWRKLTAPAVIAGHRLPAGTLVFPAIALVQTSESLFPDPEEFRPERFLDGSPAPYTFIPFGGGIRRCIGAAFAVMEMKTVLCTVLSRVELTAADQRPEHPRTHHVTQIPHRGTRVIARAP
jgi:cytochrome P450 family 135